MTERLTTKEQGRISRQKLMDFIVSYMLEYGYPPSYREMEDAVCLSISNIHRHIQCLKDMGVLTTEDGSPRTICVKGIRYVDERKESEKTYT